MSLLWWLWTIATSINLWKLASDKSSVRQLIRHPFARVIMPYLDSKAWKISQRILKCLPWVIDRALCHCRIYSRLIHTIMGSCLSIWSKSDQNINHRRCSLSSFIRQSIIQLLHRLSTPAKNSDWSSQDQRRKCFGRKQLKESRHSWSLSLK